MDIPEEADRWYQSTKSTGPRRGLDEDAYWGFIAGAEWARKQVREARAQHPKCDVHPNDDPVACGWKRTVLDIDAALGEVR